jgi:hypothetical protein
MRNKQKFGAREVRIYVDSSGKIYRAGETDQRYTRATERTVHGRPVFCAGSWHPPLDGDWERYQAVCHPFYHHIKHCQYLAGLHEALRS